MAAAKVLQSPHQLDTMPPKQRAPLSNIAHALNSPLRPSSKRPRAEVKGVFDDVSAPPFKRQNVDHEHYPQYDRENIPPQPVTPQKRKDTGNPLGLGELNDNRSYRHGGRVEAEDRARILRQQAVLAKEREREREAARHARCQEEKSNRNTTPDEIARWQNATLRKFPDFVFFFENIPENARRVCSRQVRELGAQEDKFFSRGVTHVITTRAVPTQVTTPSEERPPSLDHQAAQTTINPALLDNRSKTIDELTGHSRVRSVFDVALSKKSGLNPSPEKPKTSKVDILQKAVDLGIKVWQLEKLQRVLSMLLDRDEHGDYIEAPHERGSRTVTRVSRKQEESLSTLMKREEKNKSAASELDFLQSSRIVPFQAPYIFVRCMNEKTKPLMVRQYEKVKNKQDGDWPQFRAVSQGKCPFIIEDRSRERREPEKKVQAREAQATVNDRAAETREEATGHEFHNTKRGHHVEKLANGKSKTLDEAAEQVDHALETHRTYHQHEPNVHDNGDMDQEDDETEDDPDVQGDEDATTDAPQVSQTENEADVAKHGIDHVHHSRQTSFDMMAPPAPLPRPNPANGRPGGEPEASGLQKSGATTAIRSTMGISSMAAQPGLKAGTTRDIHSLQRRVLDRYSTGTGSGSGIGMSAPAIPSAAQGTQKTHQTLVESRRMADIAGYARADNPRAAKVKAQEKIHAKPYTTTASRQGYDLEKVAQGREREPEKPKTKKELKPGYCENCKDKFDDFEEHIASRKHRRFATNKDNWTELDALLEKLVRPRKRKYEGEEEEEYDDDDYGLEMGVGQAYKRSRVF